MKLANEFTVTELADMFGVKPRSIQIWSDRGVIEPIAGTKFQGQGTSKLFSREETLVAGIVAAMYSITSARVGRLNDIANLVRSKLSLSDNGLRLESYGEAGIESYDEADTEKEAYLSIGRVSSHGQDPDDASDTMELIITVRGTDRIWTIPYLGASIVINVTDAMRRIPN